MRLQNQTRCPTALLVRVIEHAKQTIGVKDECNVKVTRSRSERITGLATRNAKHFHVKVSLPKVRFDALDCAYRFWKVCLHEWGHIKDYEAMAEGQTLSFAYYQPGRVNRIAHDKRPQEIRADNYVEEAKQRIAAGQAPGCDDAILELAIWLETERGL